MNYKDLEKILNAIQENNRFLILIHDKPDGDAVGSSTALSLFMNKLGKTSVILSPTPIPKRLEFLKDDNAIYFDSTTFTENVDYDYIITIDVASYELLGNIPEGIKKNINYVIDHHKINTLCSENKYTYPEASAAGEIVYLLISMYSEKTNNSYFDKNICKALFASISSDTGCFKYGNTTSLTHEIASKLLNFEINAEEINRLLFDTKSYTQIKVEQLAYQNLKMFYNDKLAIVTINKSELNQIGATEDDTETISQLARMIQNVSIGVLMREKTLPDGKTGYKFSVRSNYDADVAELCSAFGGGGHKKAAGCTISADENTALNLFVDEAKKYI